MPTSDHRVPRHALRLVILAALAVFVAVAYAQATPPKPQPRAASQTHAVTIPWSSHWDMTSRNGRTYRIFVAWPPPPAKPPKQGYPVIYVLDGNALFATALTVARLGTGDGELQPAVIVGIGYPTDDPKQIDKLRVFDLTPPNSQANLAKLKTLLQGAKAGGADQFRAFITDELEPKIASMFPVDPNDRNLIGYSIGGLFVLDTLFKQPRAFRNYVAASPSIWWNDKAVLVHEPQFERTIGAGKAAPRVLLTVGGLEQTPTPVKLPPGMTHDAYVKLLKMASMIDNVRALGARLQKLQGAPGYLVQTRVYDDETHTSVVTMAVARGVRFALAPAATPAQPIH